VALALYILAALAGCGRPPLHNADASRDTQTAFNRDRDDCRRESLYRNAHPRWGENPLFPYLVVDEERAAECMKARGWRQRDTH
jgi:predicted small lipoprotein YifL